MGFKKKSVKPDIPQEDPIVEDQSASDESSTPRSLVVSSERLNCATTLVTQVFNIPEGFSVIKFNDKGKVIELSLDGDDFIVSVVIKNSEAHPGFVLD